MPGNNLTRLVEAIHGAAFDETRWPSILEHVADALGSRNASMVRANRTTGQAQAIAVGLDPSAHGLFVGYYSKRNPLPQHSEIDDAFGRRAVVARAHVRELLLRSEYHNDFLKPFGMAHLAWVFLDRDGTDVAMLNVGRPERLDAYDRSDLERFTWLMPHLMRSYAIGRRLGGLGAAGGTLVQYLNGLPHGVVLLDAFGRIMHANRSAEIIASTADGLTFTRDGLLAATPVANTVLRAAIARAADPRHLPQAAQPGPAASLRRPATGRCGLPVRQ
jgi:hypothetical protein